MGTNYVRDLDHTSDLGRQLSFPGFHRNDLASTD